MSGRSYSQKRQRDTSSEVALTKAEKRQFKLLTQKLGMSEGSILREMLLDRFEREGIVDPGPATPASLDGTLLETIAA